MKKEVVAEHGTELPIVNESGYYEIRLESIGGLGANLCGKMLGELGLYVLGLNSSSFSSYGSEKTGTPVKAYIRYCAQEKEIRVHSPVQNPHLAVVFHEALLQNPATLKGCGEETTLLINSGTRTEAKVFGGNVKEVYTVPAQQIAMETRARINVVCWEHWPRSAVSYRLRRCWKSVSGCLEENIRMRLPEIWRVSAGDIMKYKK